MGQNNDPKEHGDLQGQQGSVPKNSDMKNHESQSGQRPGGNTQTGQGSQTGQKNKQS